MALVGSHQQAPVTIPVNGTSPIDAQEVRLNDNAIVTSYNAHDADPTLHIQSSSLSTRPLAGQAGRLWFVTDSQQLFYDTGGAWVPVKVSGSSVVGGTVPINAGGTGTSSLPTDGQVLIGNSGAYSLATLTAGPNTVITNGPGGITISCLGAASGTTSRTVTTATATAGQTTFAVTYLPGYIDVYLNGVYLVPVTDYTATTGTNVVLTSGAALNDELVFVAYTQLSLAAVVNGTGTANQLARWVGTGTVANSQITDDGSVVGLPRYTNVRNVSYSWPSAQGGANAVLTNNGSGTLSWALPVANLDQQTFDSSGTWTKPSNGSMALIEVWGAGGSGSNNSTATQQNGGAGGGYAYRLMKLSDLGSTETVTIGAGGAARTTIANGVTGGDSSFGSWVTAYGGAGGSQAPGYAYGGSVIRAGVVHSTSGYGTMSLSYVDYYDQIYAGGSATCGLQDLGVLQNSLYGGGAGASSSNSGSIAAGTSAFGGNGGATATAGSAPAGGGGRGNGVSGGTSGAGASGRVRITVW